MTVLYFLRVDPPLPGIRKFLVFSKRAGMHVTINNLALSFVRSKLIRQRDAFFVCRTI